MQAKERYHVISHPSRNSNLGAKKNNISLIVHLPTDCISPSKLAGQAFLVFWSKVDSGTKRRKGLGFLPVSWRHPKAALSKSSPALTLYLMLDQLACCFDWYYYLAALAPFLFSCRPLSGILPSWFDGKQQTNLPDRRDPGHLHLRFLLLLHLRYYFLVYDCFILSRSCHPQESTCRSF